MDNNIKSNSSFFPNAKRKRDTNQNIRFPHENSTERKESLDRHTRNDAKVDISEGLRDYSWIKRAVDLSPEVDNSEKIEMLRRKIASGEYNVDYDRLAEKIIGEEFGY